MSGSSSNKPQECDFNQITSKFRPALIEEILKTNFSNSKTKMSDETVDLMNKISKILVVETSVRAIKQAKAENKSKVNLDHVEIILPQLMLDFP